MKAIIHIGPPKSGTSSIQRFIRTRRDTLNEAGVFVPRTRSKNMREFYIAADTENHFQPNETGPRRNMQKLRITRETYVTQREEFLKKLHNQLSDAQSKAYQSVIITSEGLSSRISMYKAQSIKQMFGEYFSDYIIIAAFRRQDYLCISRYTNMVLFGGESDRLKLVHRSHFHAPSLVEGWRRVYGDDAIRPFIFPDSGGSGGDLIERFCAAAGISEVYDPEEEEQPTANRSPDGRALELMRNINSYDRGAARKADRNRRRLERLLKISFEPPAQKILPSQLEVIKFLSQYKSSNEIARLRYFPDQENLFDMSVERYPESPLYPEPSRSELYKLIYQMSS